MTIEGSRSQRVLTLEDLLKKTKVDLEVWFVKDYVVNKWDVTAFQLVGDKKLPITHEN